MTFSREPVLSVQELEVIFSDASGTVHALGNLSFNIGENEFACLIGPSGSGKSTLLRVLAGLVEPTHGSYHYHNHRDRVGLVFQNPNLMPWRRVVENISLPLELNGTPGDEIQQRVTELIKLVQLEGFENAYPRDLSGGMAQRVAIVRSLIQDPDILLLDEPFGALDALTRENMGEELLQIWQARKKTVLMVTHSISEALYLSDKVMVLSHRPGTIELELSVDLPRPRKPEIRYTPEFNRLSHTLRDHLR